MLQPDGKVIIAGYTVLETVYDLAMARFDVDGNLDDTVGVDGMVNTDLNGGEDYGKAIALQPDNKIILVGYSFTTSGNAEIVVARYDNKVLGAEDFQNIGFSIYPNPTNDYITIDLNGTSSSYQVAIFDMLGKNVYSTEIEGTKQIDVSSLAAGAYFVKLNSNSQSTTIRLIKQ